MIIRLVVDECGACLRMHLDSIRYFCIAPYCANCFRILRVIGFFSADFMHSSGGANQSVSLSVGHGYSSAPFAGYFGALSLSSS